MCVTIFIPNTLLIIFSDELIHSSSISKPKYAFLSPEANKLHYETLKNESSVQKFIIFGDANTNEISYSQLITSGNTDVPPANFYGEKTFQIYCFRARQRAVTKSHGSILAFDL